MEYGVFWTMLLAAFSRGDKIERNGVSIVVVATSFISFFYPCITATKGLLLRLSACVRSV
jgi:hypothetical protein